MHTTLDNLITDAGAEKYQHHENIRKIIAKSIYSSDDAEFIQKGINKREKV